MYIKDDYLYPSTGGGGVRVYSLCPSGDLCISTKIMRGDISTPVWRVGGVVRGKIKNGL